MIDVKTAINECHIKAEDSLPDWLLEKSTPTVLRGFINDWPLVAAAKTSDAAIQNQLLQAYNGNPVHVMSAPASVKGRLFYNDDLTGFNFTRANRPLNEVFDELNALHKRNESANSANAQEALGKPTIYVGSTVIDKVFTNLRNDNDLQCLRSKALASIWMGNQTRIAAHYDAPDNIACVVAGQRRFTLFPPEQIDNLYIGPIDFTPAGQPASLVDFHEVDYQRYPKFKDALAASQSAILNPGDAIYIPANWWHHIEALSDFNVLINYWWRQVEDYVGVPNDALLHAILAIKPLPLTQRKAWQQIFDHYIFCEQDHAHIPDEVKGVLSEIDATAARRLRALIVNKLNR